MPPPQKKKSFGSIFPAMKIWTDSKMKENGKTWPKTSAENPPPMLSAMEAKGFGGGFVCGRRNLSENKSQSLRLGHQLQGDDGACSA